MTYERVVTAALAETTSKFKLAEALALDIPPRRRGPTGPNEESVRAYLRQARQAILDAGGEPRHENTLDEYRLTALWVSRDLSRNFAWLPGVSYSAHTEARKSGLTYETFEAMPSRTVDAVRDAVGRAGTDGPPESIVADWTPEQKVEAAKALITEPAVADEVVRDPQARSHMQSAVERGNDRVREQWQREHPPTDSPEPAPSVLDELTDLVGILAQGERFRDQLVAWAQKAGPVARRPDIRDALHKSAQQFADTFMAILAIADSTGSMDDELARLLDQEDRK